MDGIGKIGLGGTELIKHEVALYKLPDGKRGCFGNDVFKLKSLSL